MASPVPIPKADSDLFHSGFVETVPPFILTLDNHEIAITEQEAIAMSRAQTQTAQEDLMMYKDVSPLDHTSYSVSGSRHNLQNENHPQQLHCEDDERVTQDHSIPAGTSCESLQFHLESRTNSFSALVPRNFDKGSTDIDDKTTGTSSQTYSQPSLECSSQSTISPQRSSPPSNLKHGHGRGLSLLEQLVENDKSYLQPRADENEVTVRPFVYSAIGSLENVTQHSFGSFQNKVLYLATHNKSNKPRNVNACLSDTSKINKRKIKSNNKPKKETTHHSPLNYIHDLSPELNVATADEKAKERLDMLKDDNSERSRRQIVKSSSDGALAFVVKKKSRRKRSQKKKKVTIDEKGNQIKNVELFRPSCDAYTPRMKRGMDIKFKPAEQRGYVKEMTGTMGTIQRPNFQDALRRVAMIIHQHIVKIENRFQAGVAGLKKADLFDPAMRDAFAEEIFTTPRYKCSMVKIPMARPGVICGRRKIRTECKVPSEEDIFDFAFQLFKSVELSSECSIICLIYVERLMEKAKVPLMANTWRPILMCGLLLASKVWQDWSSWNVEFASVYPQFSLTAVNRLELQFLKMVKWDLYISSSLYAKYYFALRSLLEKQNFRLRYNRLVGGPQSEAITISRRSEVVKNNALSQLSTSM
jgi:hypothetical protein